MPFAVSAICLMFTCPECGETTTLNPYFLYLNGIPQCQNCDTDMDMEPEATFFEESDV